MSTPSGTTISTTTTSTTPGTAPAAHYERPGWFTRTLLNPSMNVLMRLGISVWGGRVLEHRGRPTAPRLISW
jgi:hypothetical protein